MERVEENEGYDEIFLDEALKKIYLLKSKPSQDIFVFKKNGFLFWSTFYCLN